MAAWILPLVKVTPEAQEWISDTVDQRAETYAFEGKLVPINCRCLTENYLVPRGQIHSCAPVSGSNR